MLHVLRHAVLASAVAAAALSPSALSPSAPTIDGLIDPKEWSGARREHLIGNGGGELLLLRADADLYVAVTGAGPGYPSLCVGDAERVEVMHASAALGSVSYARTNDRWRRGKPFEWRVRDAAGAASTLLADRESFFAEYRWLSTASRAGAPAREFRITLDTERTRLGVVFLSTDTMKHAYWPASMNDGCRNLDLLRGDAPDTLPLDPASWHRIE
jgi:hypothetical protein